MPVSAISTDRRNDRQKSGWFNGRRGRDQPKIMDFIFCPLADANLPGRFFVHQYITAIDEPADQPPGVKLMKSLLLDEVTLQLLLCDWTPRKQTTLVNIKDNTGAPGILDLCWIQLETLIAASHTILLFH